MCPQDPGLSLIHTHEVAESYGNGGPWTLVWGVVSKDLLPTQHLAHKMTTEERKGSLTRQSSGTVVSQESELL